MTDDTAMQFTTRKWVRPDVLNANGTLFGGSLLQWVDEEAAIYAVTQLGTDRIVTKFISEINFVSTASQGDLIEMAFEVTRFGHTSITLRAEVRNMITRKTILCIDQIVFVSLGADGRPHPHGQTEPTQGSERLPLAT